MKRSLLLLLISAFIGSVATAQSTLLPPTNLTVSNVTDSSFIAKWLPSVGALYYELDLSTSSNFSTGNVFIGQGTPFTSDTTTNLQAGTTYYFRVRAVDAKGRSANSAIRSLVLVPQAPLLFGVSTAGPTEVVLNWGTSKGSTGYRVDVAINTDFDSLVYSNLDARNNTSLLIRNLQPGRLYSFRVRAVNSYGISDNSNISSFRMRANVPFPTPSKSLRVYPNPLRSGDFLNVELEKLAPDANVIVSITSLAGDNSAQYEFKTGQDGTMRGRFPASSLKPGTYILNVKGLSYRFVVE